MDGIVLGRDLYSAMDPKYTRGGRMAFFKNRNSEKRIFERIPFWTKVRVELIQLEQKEDKKSDVLGAENLSGGGILIETQKPFPKDVFCRVHIGQNAYQKEFTLEGLIIRSVWSPRGNFYDTAIQFFSMNEGQKETLDQIIHEYSS